MTGCTKGLQFHVWCPVFELAWAGRSCLHRLIASCIHIKLPRWKSSHIFMTALHIWVSFSKMYLYKAACSDIHVPRQRSAQRSERTPGRFLQRQGTGLSSHHTAGCPHWEGRSNSALELQQLGHFMQIHGYSLLESVGANTKMIYRCILLVFNTVSILYDIWTTLLWCNCMACEKVSKFTANKWTSGNLLILLYEQHIYS